MRRGGTIVTIGLAVIATIALVDILRNPAGTLAAGSAANDLSVPAFSATLGAVPGYSPGRSVPK